MIVLGIDPGAAGAGYAVWDSERRAIVYVGTSPPQHLDAWHYTVVESGFIGRMGLKAMWGLGFDAGWRLCELRGMAVLGSYTIRPDGPSGWRAALPPRPDLPGAARFTKFDGLPGDVIVARLRMRYSLHASTPAGRTEHEVEACGIAEAAAAILQRPKAKDRKALKAVKR